MAANLFWNSQVRRRLYDPLKLPKRYQKNIKTTAFFLFLCSSGPLFSCCPVPLLFPCPVSLLLCSFALLCLFCLCVVFDFFRIFLNFVRTDVMEIHRLNPSDKKPPLSPVPGYHVLKSEVWTRCLDYHNDLKRYQEIQEKIEANFVLRDFRRLSVLSLFWFFFEFSSSELTPQPSKFQDLIREILPIDFPSDQLKKKEIVYVSKIKVE